MGKGLPRSHDRRPVQDGVRDLTIVIDTTITVDGASGLGFGSVMLTGLPEGNVLLLGAVTSIRFAGSGSDAGLLDTWAGDYGLGSTPASDGTISGADVDIIGSTALGPATAEVVAAVRAENATQAFINNRASTGEVNLNLLIDDASISADGVVITVLGELHLVYIMLGDV